MVVVKALYEERIIKKQTCTECQFFNINGVGYMYTPQSVVICDYVVVCYEIHPSSCAYVRYTDVCMVHVPPRYCTPHCQHTPQVRVNQSARPAISASGLNGATQRYLA